MRFIASGHDDGDQGGIGNLARIHPPDAGKWRDTLTGPTVQDDDPEDEHGERGGNCWLGKIHAASLNLDQMEALAM
ncbi:hypothetical protein MYX84_00990 [Acidobacteria bacterium AH-259-O06]|nr:hypothetical protein [Acidobacteria bacterium AH-259-O06]